ncbi:hypothetical protein Anas_08456 [Armadillidium nasatum]|uniref:Uncharacterized protein n=1 Tax=Armadillidium nasatum TaxID=96803 RepID=A0A5N5TM19_9CRUS|nr:hypothetical protein Anas_08456 [Armadillidium nasatum]
MHVCLTQLHIGYKDPVKILPYNYFIRTCIMNDQCDHLDQLMKERNVLEEKLNEFLRTNPHHLIPEMSYPLFTQQGYKTPHPAMYPPGIETYTSHQALGRRSSWQYPYELPRGRMTGGYKNRPEEFVSTLGGE